MNFEVWERWISIFGGAGTAANGILTTGLEVRSVYSVSILAYTSEGSRRRHDPHRVRETVDTVPRRRQQMPGLTTKCEKSRSAETRKSRV